MEANEFRIDNLLTLDKNQRKDLWDNQIHAMNEFFKVKTIYSDGDIALELDNEIVDISINDVSPIPLTEEWLVKLGFNKNPGNFFIKKLEHTYSAKISINLRMNSIQVCTGGYGFNVKIKYVHQLQNLFIALTGEELIRN